MCPLLGIDCQLCILSTPRFSWTILHGSAGLYLLSHSSHTSTCWGKQQCTSWVTMSVHFYSPETTPEKMMYMPSWRRASPIKHSVKPASRSVQNSWTFSSHYLVASMTRSWRSLSSQIQSKFSANYRGFCLPFWRISTLYALPASRRASGCPNSLTNMEPMLCRYEKHSYLANKRPNYESARTIQ